MTTKRLTTNSVHAEVRVYSASAVDQLKQRFAAQAQRRGTVSVKRVETLQLSQHAWLVVLEFDHTCKNNGNWRSDTRRFVENALRSEDRTFRHAIGELELR